MYVFLFVICVLLFQYTLCYKLKHSKTSHRKKYIINRKIYSTNINVNENTNNNFKKNINNKKDIINQFSLTPKLKELVTSLSDITDDKLRYQQLLFLGSKTNNFNDEFKTDENKVPGCLSVVHIHAYLKNNKIYFQGDSDAILTKGLVQLLVDGLSGYSIEEIINVNPEFIQYTGISASLTPGRNSGFLNMLNTMKNKAKFYMLNNDSKINDLVEKNNIEKNNKFSNKTLKKAIISKLQQLDPVMLELIDTSHKHAGHAESQNLSSESHFDLQIISNVFEGKSLVQRHKIIYTLLAVEMNTGIHALSIIAKTPSEK